MTRLHLLIGLLVLVASGVSYGAPATVVGTPQGGAAGVSVDYQLPTDGPLPKTYRVTLAITDPADPKWVVDTFVAGEPRTVTAANGGRFTETWDGLDENFMPVPPGSYGVKGIYMPAETWPVDGRPHTLTAKLRGGPFAFGHRPDEDAKPGRVFGDPVNSPPGDVAAAGDRAVFTWQYLENGTNNFLIDLSRPVGLDQIVGSAPSGGAAGGVWSATDGTSVWNLCHDGGPPFIWRTDANAFGTDNAAFKRNVFKPEGAVFGMAAWRDAASTKRPLVFIAERGRLVTKALARGHTGVDEDGVNPLNRVRVLDGKTAKVLAAVACDEPRSIAVRNDRLYLLSVSQKGSFVRTLGLDGDGLPKGDWQPPTKLAGLIDPSDLDVDAAGRVCVADPKANHVYLFGPDGAPVGKLGNADAQRPGRYDRLTFMAPNRVACWRDADGKDRVIVLEREGPGRFTEWSPDGKLLREWQGLNPYGNGGWAEDPEHPEQVYLRGHGGWMQRFRIDDATDRWTLDAVWPNVTGDLGGMWRGEGDFPRIIHRDGRTFLAFGRGVAVYRFDGDRLLASAAMIRRTDGKATQFYAWHDANGDGQVQDDEVGRTPIVTPKANYAYHGDGWQADLSLVTFPEGSRDVWRLAPARFDARGNPVFETWEKLLTDPVMTAKAAGGAPAVRGGNEVYDVSQSSWHRVVVTPAGDVFTNARGGGFSPNHGVEQKVTRYAPDGKGGHRIVWRVGRSANVAGTVPGSIVGSIHVTEPMHNLIGVVDQTRAGLHVYTADEGLYVDTIFLDGSRARETVYGVGGEFFAGGAFLNPRDDKVYIKWGKATPILFEARGWTKDLAIRPIPSLPARVTIDARQIASPPPLALKVRGAAAGTVPFARFAPAPGGGPALDGSLVGWEACEPNAFRDGPDAVEVRGAYDRDHVYLRWALACDRPIRAGSPNAPERLFTHDRDVDTVGFYLQSDPKVAGNNPGGRPGDVRFVFGLFDDGTAGPKPAALAMYPTWDGPAKANPVTYGSPVGKATFAHVALRPDVRAGHRLEDNGKRLVLAVAIPRSALPAALPALDRGLRTMVNFDANVGGNHKFWWSNADGSASRETNDEPTEARLYPGAWSPAQFEPLDAGLVVKNWLVCGPFGGPGAENFNASGGPSKEATRKFYDAATYPPDLTVDPKAVFTGPQIQGYWNKAGAVRWTPSKVAEMDTRMKFGQGAQAWYAASWVYSPTDATLDCSFRTSRQAGVRYWVNGQVVAPGTFADGPAVGVLKADKAVAFRKGWNEVRLRGYCYGYAPFQAGLVIVGPADALWGLRLSDEPPAAEK